VKELRLAAGLCLVGAAAVLLAVSRSWLTYRFGQAPLPTRTVEVSGADLARGARVLGLVGLAGVAALPATRGRARTAVGLLLTAAGAGVVAVVVRVLADPTGALEGTGAADVTSPDLGGWPFVAILGGLLLVAAGLLVAVRGRGWAALAAKYDAPAEQTPPGEASLWDAIDRGEDPTRG
jgi:uncharacterized membrane protein (TIGR02234 family)